MGPEIASRFAEYVPHAAQGRLDIAAKYARFSDISCAILRDRIYNAAPVPGYQPPPFPFDMVNVVRRCCAAASAPADARVREAELRQPRQYAAQGQATAQFGAQPQAAAGFGAPQPVGM
ncbi:hypothetical protein PINS_up020762 [Pythium insidiosum]|nr:hypothetical protein PINS_up020762 [Pythium insidiosum]